MTLRINGRTYDHGTISLHVGGELVDAPIASINYTAVDRAWAGPSAPLCWKCRDGGARAHHRWCPKRGAGHRGRGAELCRFRGQAMQLGLRVRIGRYVDGLSLPEARRRAMDDLQGQWRAQTKAAVMEAVRRVARCAADISTLEPGVVQVRLLRRRPAWMLDKVHKVLQARMAIGALVRVESATEAWS